MSSPRKIAYQPPRRTLNESSERAQEFHELMSARRSVRHFSSEPVPRKWIELAIATASTSPSGAHRQPWHFVAVRDPETKRKIRVAAEAEEYESYERGRMPLAWRQALEPISTDWQKPFLETVPWIVVVFEEVYGMLPDGKRRTNYYVKESVGMACGMLIASLHHMGLATLTHTPSPMGFLGALLNRPSNERPFVLIPIGYPAKDCKVPKLERKPLDSIASWI